MPPSPPGLFTQSLHLPAHPTVPGSQICNCSQGKHEHQDLILTVLAFNQWPGYQGRKKTHHPLPKLLGVFLDLSATQQGLSPRWSHLDIFRTSSQSQEEIQGELPPARAQKLTPRRSQGKRETCLTVHQPECSGMPHLPKPAQHLQCERLEGIPSSSSQVHVKSTATTTKK